MSVLTKPNNTDSPLDCSMFSGSQNIFSQLRWALQSHVVRKSEKPLPHSPLLQMARRRNYLARELV